MPTKNWHSFFYPRIPQPTLRVPLPHRQIPASAPKLQSSLTTLGPRKAAVRRASAARVQGMCYKKEIGLHSCPISPHSQIGYTILSVLLWFYRIRNNPKHRAGMHSTRQPQDIDWICVLSIALKKYPLVTSMMKVN